MILDSVRSLLVRGGAVLASSAVVLAVSGCAMGAIELSGPAPSTNVTLKGSVFGGEQPVSLSTIQLWTVGTTGYGSAGTGLISNANQLIPGVALTDTNGIFNITGTFTCPTSNTLVYITASGGNPGLTVGTNNTAIKLAAALGTCGSLNSSTNIIINEVTTVAAAYALGQYFTTTFGGSSTDSFGAPSTTQAQTGITNAFGTVNNLVSNATGTAVQTATITNATFGNITITAEYQKLNTIADILATCVSSASATSSNCSTLFGAVVPTSGTQPTDTLQAAVDMSLNPTSNNANTSTTNLASLWGLAQATGAPFTGLSAQPADWTIGIGYNNGGTGTTQTFFNSPNGVAIDSNGNVWVINLDSGATATESMAEMSPTGTPLANPFNGGGAAGATTMSAASPRNIAIDTNNDVFATSSSGSSYIYEYSSGGVTSSLNVGSQGYGITIDGNNNVFVSHNSGTTIGFEEFLGGTLASTARVEFPFNSINQFAALDTSGNLYLAQGSTASTQVLKVSGMNAGTCTTFPCTTTNDASLTATYTPITTGSISTPYGLAADKNGGMWVTSSGSSSVTYINSSGVGTNYGTTASFTTPRFVAVDGNNIAWLTNRGTTSISEIKSDGTILSPVSTTTPSAVGFSHNLMSTQQGIAIDPSGNVWVANNTAAGTAANSVFEMVGAAAPTVTPIALALKNGTVGQKP